MRSLVSVSSNMITMRGTIAEGHDHGAHVVNRTRLENVHPELLSVAASRILPIARLIVWLAKSPLTAV